MTLVGTELGQDAPVRLGETFFLRVYVRRMVAKQLVRGGGTQGR
jgi:hypothetical protein